MVQTSLLVTDRFPRVIEGYYGEDWLLILAQRYVVDRAAQPYSRLSYSIYISDEPLLIDIVNLPKISTRAVLLAPGILRRSIIADASPVAIVDIPVQARQALWLKRLLGGRMFLELDYENLLAVMGPIWQGAVYVLPGEAVRVRLGALFRAICGCGDQPAPGLDPRIRLALTWLRTLPPGEVNSGALAERLKLSGSRFRHLFKQELGVSPQEYLRSQLLWRAMWLWEAGGTLTELAHQCGAYDLAHFDRVFSQAFGRSPSSIFKDPKIQLIRCQRPAARYESDPGRPPGLNTYRIPPGGA